MQTSPHSNPPWWLIPHALGADAVFAVFMWGLVCAEMLQVELRGSGCGTLLACGAWACVMSARLVRAARGADALYGRFYQRYKVLLLGGVLSAWAVVAWMLVGYVGQGLLGYASYVGALLVWSLCVPGQGIKSMCRGVAMALACMAPALYYSSVSVYGALFYSPALWGVAGVLSLFCWHRAVVDNKRNRVVPVLGGLMLMWILASLGSAQGQARGESFFFVWALTCVELLSLYVRRKGRVLSDALDWLLLGLAAAGGWGLLAFGWY